MNPALIAVVAATRTLLLDFDGPVCSIFAGHPAPTVADQLRALLADHDGHLAALASELDDASDPMRVLRVAGESANPALTRIVADALRDAEVTAAATASPTPHVDRVIETALSTGRRLAVVSNNSAEAVSTYLRRMGLLSSFTRVFARYDGMAPELMKPHSHLVGLALVGLDASPGSTCLVGDTVPDVEAAGALSVATVGYANKPGKVQALTAAGADAVITTMSDLADALAETPTKD